MVTQLAWLVTQLLGTVRTNWREENSKRSHANELARVVGKF